MPSSFLMIPPAVAWLLLKDPSVLSLRLPRAGFFQHIQLTGLLFTSLIGISSINRNSFVDQSPDKSSLIERELVVPNKITPKQLSSFPFFLFDIFFYADHSKTADIFHSKEYERLVISFALSLATTFGHAFNIVATSLDSEEMLRLKYHGSAVANVGDLKDLGCTVLHGVDANTMSQHPYLKHMKFDRIVFNFPHAGFMKREHDPYQISLHQEVVRGFMRNGCAMLTKKGEVHVTHKIGYPYSEWGIEGLGEEAGLELSGRAGFCRYEYPFYMNKKGAGVNVRKTFPVGSSCTYKFIKSY